MRKAFAHRSLGTAVRAVFEARHYRAAKNMLLTPDHPFTILKRYLFGSGGYPASVRLRTPLGVIQPVLYCYDDILTLNEVFCRGDYRCPSTATTIVDFGSNIGMSALYFLTRNQAAFAYLFEPLPQNEERLRSNLRGFEERYELSPVAIALENGEAEFGYEKTGRYGGIGLAREQTLRVRCRAANEALREVLRRHGAIDVLKIDIESLEREVLLNIPAEMLLKVEDIFVETDPMFETNPLPSTHVFRRYGRVARFHKKDQGRNPKMSKCKRQDNVWSREERRNGRRSE